MTRGGSAQDWKVNGNQPVQLPRLMHEKGRTPTCAGAAFDKTQPPSCSKQSRTGAGGTAWVWWSIYRRPYPGQAGWRTTLPPRAQERGVGSQHCWATQDPRAHSAHAGKTSASHRILRFWDIFHSHLLKYKFGRKLLHPEESGVRKCSCFMLLPALDASSWFSNLEPPQIVGRRELLGRRSQIIFTHRWHDHLCGKPSGIYKLLELMSEVHKNQQY